MKNQAIKNAKLIPFTAIILCGFFINSFAAIPPTNDDFGNAEVVSGIAVHVTRSNVGATKEVGEPNHAGNAGGKSVWFKWTAPMSITMKFTTNRSVTNIDTLLGIYTGISVNPLVQISSSDNIHFLSNLRSFTSASVQAGTTYLIALDGSSVSGQAAEGDFLLDIQPSFQYQGADFDADGITDLSYFRPSNGTWNIFKTSDQQISVTQFGTSGDIPLVYSNSRIPEITVFRPLSGFWFVRPSCCPDRYTQYGFVADIPIPATFGGNSNTAIAVFRPSEGIWYIRFAEDNYRYYQFGQAGDIPIPGQYSPDPFADVAVFRPSNGTWYFVTRISNVSNQDSFNQIQFGQSGDKPVPADYDGDGILDVAVYRPSTGVWWILQSSNGLARTIRWGIAEDIPTTGDFDGDGFSDAAVFRPSNGTWYVLRSSDNSVQIRQFGQTGDIPITANKTF